VLPRFIRDRRSRRLAQALRRAVVELPVDTRRAMLSATHREELIVGGYTDRFGRACPMLAAYRRGARSHVGSFPKSWDSFARASRPRPATRRELEVLKALLEESLADSELAAGRAPSARPTVEVVSGISGE
jgi:hypothetical protein